MNKKTFYSILSIISIAAYLISVIGCLIAGIISIVHMFKNPELTITQNTVWFFKETNYWKWLVSLFSGYTGMVICKRYFDNNKKTKW